MRLRLVVRYNSFVIDTLEIDSGEYEIGRGSENEININHPSIHRKHGKLILSNDQWIYQDYKTQKTHAVSDLEPVALSSEIDIATENYTLSETTGDIPRLSLFVSSKNRILYSFVLVGAILLGSLATYAYLKIRSRHADPNQLLAQVRSKVVEFEKIKNPQAIEDYKKFAAFKDEDFRENIGFCTGFFVAPNVILTASHCLWGSDFLDVQTDFDIRMSDGKTFKPFRILGFDPVRDYLFLEVQGAESYGHLEFADSYQIGQTVYTLGNAHGQGIAIREGIMANETADVNDPSIKYIRFSAGASPGNSGGPLLDTDGKIVALVFAATGAENYNLGTSSTDLKVGFEKFVLHRDPQKVIVLVRKLFNFNFHNFLQKQILPFLPDYNEQPEVQEKANQIQLEFTVPILFSELSQQLLTEINNKSTLALKEVLEALKAKKEVVLDWKSFVSEKTPVVLPSQFDASQNSFYLYKGRYYMKLAGFLDSPSRKDFKLFVEQFEKEKKFDFQAYGMNVDIVAPQPPEFEINYLPRNTTKAKASIDELAQGTLYSQFLFAQNVTDPLLPQNFLKHYLGEEGVLSGTYSAFIRPQAYKNFTIQKFDKAVDKATVVDGSGRSWTRWHFQIFDQLHFYIYCLPVPEGTLCAARLFPVENDFRKQLVESNFREYILGHFFENPYFWNPNALFQFLQNSNSLRGMSSFAGQKLTDQGTHYSLLLDAFQIELQIPAKPQSLRLQTGLYWNRQKQQAEWTGYGAEWIVNSKNPKLCGAMVEPLGSQSVFVLNFLRDSLKRIQLKDEEKKEELPKLWTQKITNKAGVELQLVGYCAPIRENPVEIGYYFADFKKAKPFTVSYKSLQ